LNAIPDEIQRYKGKWLPIIAYGNRSFIRKAFLIGCFDYVKEPVQPEEIYLRVKRLESLFEGNYSLCGRKLILEGNQLIVNDRDIELTYGEMQIIKKLLQFKNRIVLRDILFYALWGQIPDKPSRIIDVYISSLNKKLKEIFEKKIISSVRGTGYIIAD
jgi:DNA-binding response OmpR family regulator